MTKYWQLNELVNTIVEASGFSDRAQQYSMQRKLADGLVCKRRLVKHRVSGAIYELKQISKVAHQTQIDRFKQEISVQQHMREIR